MRYNFIRILPEVIPCSSPVNCNSYFQCISDWIAGDDSLPGNWAPEELSDFLSLRMQQAPEGKYHEIENRPQDAIMYHNVQKVIQIVFSCTIGLAHVHV